jgi:arabinogalactan oligomer/maltooligosaccharide transport system substrate-binding protein
VTAGNTIEPIDFYLDKNLTGRFIPSTMQAMTYRKTVYGLPLNYKVMTMIYNKALVKTPPKTTAELVTVAKANTNAAAGRFGLVYWYSNWYYHAPLFNAYGGGVFDAAGKPVINSAANVKSVDLMMKWSEKDKILPAEPSTALSRRSSTKAKQRSSSAVRGSSKKSAEDPVGTRMLPTVNEAGGKQ